MTDNVLDFRRPPVVQSTQVRSSLNHTFEIFIRDIGIWWPTQPFSYGTDRVISVNVERRLGGRVVETWIDGTTREWGELIAWNPPHGLAMTWNVTGTPTEVEFRFRPIESDVTEVTVEHRGWEKLTEPELTAACALPGGYLGGSFERGWRTILQALVDNISGSVE